MRPFKMFFGISLAVILFLFFARFFLMAFVAAAIMSGFFFLFRRMGYFMQRADHGYNYPYQRQLPEYTQDDVPFYHKEELDLERKSEFRTIKIQ